MKPWSIVGWQVQDGTPNWTPKFQWSILEEQTQFIKDTEIFHDIPYVPEMAINVVRSSCRNCPKQGGNVPLLKTILGKSVGSTVFSEYTNHKFWTPFLDDLFFASAAKIAICLGWKWKRPYNSPVLSFWPYVFSLQLCLVLWKVGLPDVIVQLTGHYSYNDNEIKHTILYISTISKIRLC